MFRCAFEPSVDLTWGLAVMYWLHMLATIVWIGGLAALALFVLPAARRSLSAENFATLMEQVQRWLDPVAWLCLVVLIATGLFQMSASPKYQGFLSIDNRWATAIFAKHLVFLALIASSAALTWGVLPALRRITWLRASGRAAAGAFAILEKRQLRLLRLNLVLGVIILGLTALARVS
jgi:uncharacterized membrane protein